MTVEVFSVSDKMIDVRFHGRGGQGVVTGARLLAEAALLEGKYVHSFPSFGPERSGAPITGFTRLSGKKFYLKTEIYEPDIVIVQDNTLLEQVNVLAGIKKDGLIIVNHSNKKVLMQKLHPPASVKVGIVNATKIAETRLGRPTVNTAMIGAIVKLTAIVNIDNVISAVKTLFPGPLGEKNALAIMDAYNTCELIPANEFVVSKSKDTFLENKGTVLVGDQADFNEWIKNNWGYSKVPIGTVVPYPGSSLVVKTGDWAATQPKLIKEKCHSCLTCFFVCPDNAITMDFSENPNGYPVINTDYCKGCGLCAYECEDKALIYPGIVDPPVTELSTNSDFKDD